LLGKNWKGEIARLFFYMHQLMHDSPLVSDITDLGFLQGEEGGEARAIAGKAA
jgi:hypothetical protein